MSIIVPLSSVPAERLKALADAGEFPWGDPDAAQPIIQEACAGSGGDPDREAELILLALREKVPNAIRRAIDRNPDVRMERCLDSVAEHYSQLKQTSVRINPVEARWSVDTLAAMATLITPESVGKAASTPEAGIDASILARAESCAEHVTAAVLGYAPGIVVASALGSDDVKRIHRAVRAAGCERDDIAAAARRNRNRRRSRSTHSEQ